MIAPKISSGNQAPAKPAANSPVPTSSGQNNFLKLLDHPEIKARLNALLTDKQTLNAFIGVMTGLVRTNPKLAQCTEASFLTAMIKCATLKLFPNDPIRQHCWLIPRKNKKLGTLECNWEAGYKGLVELGFRSDEVESIQYAEIYERDYFDVDWGTNIVSHKLPSSNRFDRGEVEAYWAQWAGKNGVRGKPVLMTIDQMNAHVEQYVEGKDSEYSPWNTAYNEMALKTVIKRAMKTAPLSSEDLRRGLDESLPANNPAYAVSATSTPIGQGAVDPMTAPAEFYQHTQTVDAEYETVETAKPVAKETEPVPAKEPVASQSDIDEQHRQDWLKQVMVKVAKIPPEEITVKCGMPLSMIKKADIKELQRIFGELR